MPEKIQSVETWAAIEGRWEFEGDSAVYLGPVDASSPYPHGVALGNARLRSGSIQATIRFREKHEEMDGRILFGYHTQRREYLSAGMGGHGRAYVLSEYLPGRGWRALSAVGSSVNLEADTDYQVEVQVRGQRIRLTVDGIKVVEHSVSQPLPGDQVGLFAWGTSEIEFKQIRVASSIPEAFVVMQFGEPYDALYTDVLKPVSEEMGLDAYRVDDVFKPGIILQDIIRGIVEAEVVIAEVTPANPNVFYELGYAHALDKATILLAERGERLPFDVSGYRCIFYDNTIRGKKEVEDHLRNHLANVLRDL